MAIRQKRNLELLRSPRKVHQGEVEHEIDKEHLHRAPEPVWDAQTIEHCRRIFARYVEPETGLQIPQSAFCDLPKWVFLEYAVQFCGSYLSGRPGISPGCLERKRLSLNLVGWDEPSYIVLSSSVEAIYHAVLDNERLHDLDCPIRIIISLPTEGSERPNRMFYVGLDYRSTPFGPWTFGTVSLFNGAHLTAARPDRPFHMIEELRPMASVSVAPLDWPMLDKVDSVDIVASTARTNDAYRGFPWVTDETIHPRRCARPLVEAACHKIQADLAEPIALEHLGRFMGCSPFATLRIFRAAMGISPYEYQTSLRLILAKSLLRQGRRIADAAIEAGFYDQSHFSRHFQGHFGLTPGQYLRTQ